MLVPKHLDPSEKCIRCVLHPLMYSNSKHQLKREAMLPPRNSTKVSLLRLDYTEEGLPFCVNHGKSLSIDGQTFVGLASITPKMVEECSDKILKTQSLHAEVVYAPMHQGEYVDTSIDVDTQDPNIDLPMHADLTYDTQEEGDVRTVLRMFANELVKRASFIEESEIILLPKWWSI